MFAQLALGEQHLARAWALSPRTSWAEAADLVGVTAADAVGVRRKLRRLGIRHQKRKAAARSARVEEQAASDATRRPSARAGGGRWNRIY